MHVVNVVHVAYGYHERPNVRVLHPDPVIYRGPPDVADQAARAHAAAGGGSHADHMPLTQEELRQCASVAELRRCTQQAAPVHPCSVAATAEHEQPADPEGLSHMGIVVRRAWYRLLSSDARVHLLSGAIAATVSNTIVAPLDVIRLNIMV